MNRYVVLIGIPDDVNPDDFRWETFSSGIVASSPPRAIAKVEVEILEYLKQLGLDQDQILVSAVLEYPPPEILEIETPTFQQSRERSKKGFNIQIGITNPTTDEIEWKNIIKEVIASSPSEAIEKKKKAIKEYLEARQLTEKDVLISAIIVKR